MKIIIGLFIFFSLSYGQIPNIQVFKLESKTQNADLTSLVQISENSLIMFWSDSTKLFYSKSNDLGNNWSDAKLLFEPDQYIYHHINDLIATQLKSGTIVVSFKSRYQLLLYSEDDGETWSENIDIIDNYKTGKYISIVEVSDSTIWFVYSSIRMPDSSKLYYLESNNGKDWTEESIEIVHEEINNSSYTQVIPIADKNLLMIYANNETGNNILYQKSSLDNGLTWDSPIVLVDTEEKIDRPQIIKDSLGTIWIFYESYKLTPFEEITQSDILFIKSEDNGNTWSMPKSFTNFKGDDKNHSVNIYKGKPIVSFTSNRKLSRFNEKNINNVYYGMAEISNDDLVPKLIIHDLDFRFEENYLNKDMIINAKIEDNDSHKVMFNYSLNKSDYFSLNLYDDGEHEDEYINDKNFGNRINNLSNNFSIDYFIETTDSQSNKKQSDTINYKSPFDDSDESYAMDINNIWLPLNNRGVIADVAFTRLDGKKYGQGRFEESYFLYSSGFALTGYNNGELWGNNVFFEGRYNDYLPGKVGGEANDEKNRVYYLKKEYPAFSETWQTWKDAVSLGAGFYDGDGDGEYNPTDKNSNGEWDENEDKPEFVGDQTAWCVFNDNKPSEDRNYANMEPLGIEIKQTVFGYASSTFSELSNVVFVNYEIENKGIKSDLLDSVYYGVFYDPDLGDYSDDLIGVDTILNSSYCYNYEYDDSYGYNPPALAATYLQGPIIYIPNKSYIDQNSNNVYDEGVDTALDTAKVLSLNTFNKSKYPGAKNQSINASINIGGGSVNLNGPDNILQLRCFMEGKTQACNYLDPCEWELGEVFNLNCEDVNPRIMCSGDPVSKNGWLDIQPFDKRSIFSTGPFNLEKEKPIEIMIAYSVGRGTDALNSVTVTKETVKDVLSFYDNDFKKVPVGVKKTLVPVDYLLQQNYPNPFNPNTKIEFSIPKQSNVELEIFDALGRKVKALVNKKLSTGNHTVNFNASSLSSGIYFYRIISDKFISTKKMIFLK